MLCTALLLAFCACGSGSRVAVVSARVGSTQVVPAGARAELEAIVETPVVDPDLSFFWWQTGGPPVKLEDESEQRAWFVAPDSAAVLDFRVATRLAGRHAGDLDVRVRVRPRLGRTATRHLASFAAGTSLTPRAETSAYHGATRRLFTVDSAAQEVAVHDLSDPAAPRRVRSLDVRASFPSGQPVTVAVSGDTLAVALENTPPQAPGVVQLWGASTLALHQQLTVGAKPSMAVFTPDGTTCLVANAGEPDDAYLTDPLGSVTVIELLGPPDRRPARATEVDFRRFDPLADLLRRQGVRIYGPRASVSRDLEPEHVAVSADSKTAFVTCQENNAVATLDLASRTFTAVDALGFKSWSAPDQVRDGKPSFHLFYPLTELGISAGGTRIRLGGFSGLDFKGFDRVTDDVEFYAVSDAGPRLPLQDLDADGELDRPFVLPDYQPRIVRFDVDQGTAELKLIREVPLTRQDGITPITGRPNLMRGRPGLAHRDVWPVDPKGRRLPLDPLGADFSGVLRLPDKRHWMCDRYRPSIYWFEGTGRLIERFVPAGTNAPGESFGVERLPAVYAQRRAGHGFAALAYDGLRKRVYAWMQSPLDNPDAPDDAVARSSRIVRILEFDPERAVTTGEYVYVLDDKTPQHEITAATWAGRAGQFFVIEQESGGERPLRTVRRVALGAATNLTTLGAEYDRIAGPGGVLERTRPDDLGRTVPVVPVHKSLFLVLDHPGHEIYDSPAGLARTGDGRLAILNHGNYGLTGARLEPGGRLRGAAAAGRVALALVTPQSQGLDASDRDDTVDFRPWPSVFGIYQPDAIASFEALGRSWLVTANEGEWRDNAGLDENDRVQKLTLDPRAFPNRDVLQLIENLGRLRVSNVEGDLDRDGDYDQLYAFGGRSFTIWSAPGEPVFDSSNLLARRTLDYEPTPFRDSRSDEKGGEPEALAVGTVDGRPVLFVGLERFDGILVWDVADPRAPRFLDFLIQPGDEGPEDIDFVPAADSPNGKPLLLVTYKTTGTVAIWEIDLRSRDS